MSLYNQGNNNKNTTNIDSKDVEISPEISEAVAR